MKSWICSCQWKNDPDDESCAKCGSPNPDLKRRADKARLKAITATQKKVKQQEAWKKKKAQSTPIAKISPKQEVVNENLRTVYSRMDTIALFEVGFKRCSAYPEMTEHYCRLDHSHIVSRDRCKKLGHPEWIYDIDNIVFHCRRAHIEWEQFHDGKFIKHVNFQKMMDFIKERDPHDWERRMEIVVALTRPKDTV
jgi:hypothetical protein